MSDWWGALRRVMRALTAPLVGIAVVALIGAALIGLAGPLLADLSTAGTQRDVASAPFRERDLEASFPVVDAEDDDAQRAFDGVNDALAHNRAGMLQALRSVADAGAWLASTPYQYLAPLPSKEPAAIALGADADWKDRVRFVAGHAPRTATSPARIEVALSARAAKSIGWDVGQTREIVQGDQESTTTLLLSGVYTPRDGTAAAWEHSPTTLRPAFVQRPFVDPHWEALAYTAPESFAAVAAGGWNVQGRAWYSVDSDAVTAPGRAALIDATNRFLTHRQPLPSTTAGAVTFTTGLPSVLNVSAAKDATVLTLAVALASGPAGGIVALQVLLGRLVVQRVRTHLVLLTARGASHWTVRTIMAAIVAFPAVPGALVGAIGAGIATNSIRAAVPTVLGEALLVAVIPCVFAAVLVPAGREHAPRGRIRLLVEALIVVAAAVTVVLTARNGLDTASPTGSPDPVAAVVPLTLSAVGAVLALRLLPLVLTLLVRQSRQRVGVALLVGGRTAAGEAGGQAIPLVVAVIGLGVALFASVVGSTLEHGAVDAAHRTVAADVSVTAAALDAAQVAKIGRVRGVDETVGVSTSDSVTLQTATGSVDAVVLVADTARLGRVQAGVPGALPTPAALRDAPEGAPVPMLVSQSVAKQTGSRSDVSGTQVRIVGSADDAQSFTKAARWVLVDVRYAEQVTSTGSVDRVLIRTDRRSDSGAVAAAIRDAVPQVAATQDADDALAALRADPRVPGTHVIAVIAASVGGALAFGALAVDAVLLGAGRRVRARRLQLLGADTREVAAVTAAETVPLLAAVAATGVVVATAIVTLTLPAADLRSFVGGVVRPDVTFDPVVLGAVVLAALTGLAGVLLIAVLTSRSGDSTRPLQRIRAHAAPAEEMPHSSAATRSSATPDPSSPERAP